MKKKNVRWFQVASPKRGFNLSYKVLVRCKRIATTSPIQWRPRELPGGAAEKNIKIYQNTSKNSKHKRSGGFGGRQPLDRWHASLPFQTGISMFRCATIGRFFCWDNSFFLGQPKKTQVRGAAGLRQFDSAGRRTPTACAAALSCQATTISFSLCR